MRWFRWKKVFSVQWAVFSGQCFYSNETRAGKSGLGETCVRRPKLTQPPIFPQKKQNSQEQAPLG
ncbi:MAG: hypothetical protein D6714_19915 [Bacteroidetes bacterium]|nr:MAG: hypothetical protein D6714_19915 [Bacteroidota bacterium]